ncbi:AmmeMemoRadiSam system protein B [Victivallaceae bacterium BBE-744-WT-12]|uniref:AmmeMemoRadiSam system protein B n=1 Tax=Victivallis lenta TaxID=2606640 RepID=A0A844FW73_9BACT|nr:AmmeMemoRadiSam system protein B [Victivallis lenta]MST95490.1 AmmeMemoRadiSam system protein B [Victivallis lenta]HBP06893.1 AmmeMemoRadiSam system protein B [Lentisphaeria bacterium]
MAIRDQQKVRLSAVAGTFYEGDSLLLRRRLAEAEGKLPPPDPQAPAVRGVVLPHAGYLFSLPTAMAAMAPLRKRQVSRVILLGPSHYIGFRGIAVPTFNRWRTPFGDLSTAVELIGTMGEWNSPLVAVRDDAHIKEHSLEVQLPLVQYICGQPEVLPLVVGSLSMQDVHSLASLMASLDAPGTLWIVSSDFTHYGSRFRYVPFTENVLERLREQDHAAAELIANRDLPGFAAFLGRTGATICGMNPIALFLGILDVLDPAHEIKGRIAAESNSGELTGDCSNAVGYESICFTH